MDKNTCPKLVNKSNSGQKRHFCIYCKKTIVKYARHLTTVHHNEVEVKKIIALPKQSVERKKRIENLRLEGNYLFNTNDCYNSGELIVSRRPNVTRPPEHYVPCKNCKNYYSKFTLHRHIKRCCGSQTDVEKRSNHVKGRVLARRIHQKANTIMTDKICPIMHPGLVSEIIRFDELIILFGNKLTCKYRQTHLHYHIRQILRTVARLLLTIKKCDDDKTVTDLKSIYHPKYYNLVLAAVNNLAKLDPNTNEYVIPSLATRLGNYIKKCGNLLQIEYIKTGNFEERDNVKLFLKIHEQDYGAYVNKTAEETQSRLKRNKAIILPLHEDIQKLHNYLKTEREICVNKLEIKFSYHVWLELSKYLLISVQLFNRKRAGEIERLLLTDFENRQSIEKDKDSELFKSLSEVEQVLAGRYVKVELRGKLGRCVPILLSLNEVNMLNILIANRSNAEVDENNPYVFGCPGGVDKYVRACNALREFSTKCGAKNPETLRGTELRKQIATMVQLLNLNKTELTQLASFMGHDLKIHKDHYRLPSTALQIGQLSKLFILMEEGNMAKHKGKNLQEIDLNISSGSQGPSDNLGDHLVNSTNMMPKCPQVILERVLWTTPKKRAAVRKYFGESPASGSPRRKTRRVLWPENLSSKTVQTMASLASTFSVNQVNNQLNKKSTEPVTSYKENKYSEKKYVIEDSSEEEIKYDRKRLVSMSPQTKIKRITWTTPEKYAARYHFATHLAVKSLPSGIECAAAKRNDPALLKRSVNQIKAWVNNENKRIV